MQNRMVSWALWLVVLPLLLIGLGRPPVTRSQEARVMLAAQELMEKPVSQWLVPRINGRPRFQKPPLATWMAALSFSVFGLNDFAGRLPNALAGWCTLAIVYRWARSIAGTRTALMAAGGLLDSLFFFRFTRHAETDAAAMPWVTLAFFAIWQATRRTDHDNETDLPLRKDAFHFHIAAVGAGLATMAKGGPGAFPVIFLIALAVSERSLRPIVRFLRSGAIISYALIALPWFAYVWLNADARRVIAYETSLMIRGGAHAGPFYDYFGWIIYGCLPWAAFGVAGIARAVLRFRSDPTSRDLLIAVLSILVPLCLLGQRQPHYLMSLVPVLFVLTAVEIDRMLADDKGQRVVALIFVGTVVGAALSAAAIGLLPILAPRGSRIAPLALAASLFGAAVIATIQARRRGTWYGLAHFGAVMPVVLLITFTLFWPSQSSKPNPRVSAELLSDQIGDAPAAWWGENGSLAVTYYLRRAMPLYDEDPITPTPPPPGNVLLVDCEPVAEVISIPHRLSANLLP